MTGLVIVTRPEPDASDYADELKAAGFEVFVEPMLEIRPLDFEMPDLAQYDGVLLTSANAVQIKGNGFEGTVYCVGKHTSEVARNAGFQDVISVDGTGADLLVYILALPDAEGKRFLHVCGTHVAFPIADRLNEAGIQADALPAYESIQVTAFSDAFLDVLKAGDVKAVTFFSKRTAEAFLQNAELVFSESESESLFSGIKALSISDAVVECVRVLPWAASYGSKSPDREGMMQLLKAYV